MRTQGSELLVLGEGPDRLQLGQSTLDALGRGWLQHLLQEVIGWAQLEQVDLQHQLLQWHPHHLWSLHSNHLHHANTSQSTSIWF